MHKLVTTKDDQGKTHPARVLVAVMLHPRLRAAIEKAVQDALDAYRGPRGERVVHVCDARNRVADDTPPPGADADGGSAAELEDPSEGDAV